MNLKAFNLRIKLQKRIYTLLDDNNFIRALGINLDRYNAVSAVLYPGQAKLTPGEMLDEWYEFRAFQSQF